MEDDLSKFVMNTASAMNHATLAAYQNGRVEGLKEAHRLARAVLIHFGGEHPIGKMAKDVLTKATV